MNPFKCVITGCAIQVGNRFVSADLFQSAHLSTLFMAAANVGGEKGELQWTEVPYYRRIIQITGDYEERRGLFFFHLSQAHFNEAAEEYFNG